MYVHYYMYLYRNICHEPEVNESQSAVLRDQKVPGVGVRVEETGFQQLIEEALHW